jgi:hypothetical protein
LSDGEAVNLKREKGLTIRKGQKKEIILPIHVSFLLLQLALHGAKRFPFDCFVLDCFYCKKTITSRNGNE